MKEFGRTLTRADRLVFPAPTESKKMTALAASLLRKTKKAASRFPETRGVILGGSFAKGTWLPRLVDLDIFVKIDPSTPEDRFEEIGLAIGSAATRGYPRGKKYAQHPYTEATVEAVRVNIVPCYSVKKGEWKSAADRSPFHVRLVKSLSEEKKKQVKLLKRFMKGVGVYGAEIEVRGFSGYAAEVLVIKHGSFRGVLEHFANLRPESEGRFFTLPDPVDERRDLATAISLEKLGRMMLASREFLSSPRLAYFVGVTGRHNPSVDGLVVAVLFTHPELSEDTLWGELRKTTKHVVRHLEVNGFKVARSLAASDNRESSAILIIPEFRDLPSLEQRVGPTVDREKDVAEFVGVNRKRAALVWVDDDARVRLIRPREHLRLDLLLTKIARGKAGEIGASPELAKAMKRSAVVMSGKALQRASKRTRWLEAGVREIASDAIGTR